MAYLSPYKSHATQIRLIPTLRQFHKHLDDMIKRQRNEHEESAKVFECKLCRRKFATFQALGGHRASHKKAKVAEMREVVEVKKRKVHECSVCGLEFAVGQALGGHMRRHKAVVKKSVMCMDLNLTPLENNFVMRKMGEIVDRIHVVDCFH